LKYAATTFFQSRPHHSGSSFCLIRFYIVCDLQPKIIKNKRLTFEKRFNIFHRTWCNLLSPSHTVVLMSSFSSSRVVVA
jgi:hypothetical protein